MGLHTSKVYKCLEKKAMIMGFEILDLFVVCLFLCVLNILFSTAEYKLFYTWGPTLVAAFGLKAAKRGKAENFLLHWIRYQISPGVLLAFPRTTRTNGLPRLKHKRGWLIR